MTLTQAQQQFLNNLRSENYRQGQEALRQRGEDRSTTLHCCLGVLCDTYRQLTGRGSWQMGLSCDDFILEGNHYDSYPPPEVAEFFNLTKVDPVLREEVDGDDTILHRASELNDNYGLSFAEIADLFEARFLRDSIDRVDDFLGDSGAEE